MHLALYAGGIVGSSFHAGASGVPTGSAGFASNSMNAFSKSQRVSASNSSSLVVDSAIVTDDSVLESSVLEISIFGVSCLTSASVGAGFGLRCREVDVDRWLDAPFR